MDHDPLRLLVQKHAEYAYHLVKVQCGLIEKEQVNDVGHDELLVRAREFVVKVLEIENVFLAGFEQLFVIDLSWVGHKPSASHKSKRTEYQQREQKNKDKCLCLEKFVPIESNPKKRAIK